MAAMFPEDILICIRLNENAWISINTSLTIVPKGHFNITPGTPLPAVDSGAPVRSIEKTTSSPYLPY